MSTQFPSNAETYLGSYAKNMLMYTTLPIGSAIARQFDVTPTTPAPVAESRLSAGSLMVWAWYSEQVAADYTIQTTDVISLDISAFWGTSDPNACLRVSLYKVTRGGAWTETLIGSVDDTTAQDSVNSKDTYTLSIPTPVTVAVGELLVLRFWAIPPPSQSFATGSLQYRLGASTTGIDKATLNLPAGLTFLGYQNTRVYMRRDASAVGGNFLQATLSPGPTQAAVTGVVATSNVSEKQWTRTSGGTPLEWITPRLKDAFYLQRTGLAGVYSRAIWSFHYLIESAATANAGFRLKIARWRAGVETVCCSMDYNVEAPTAAINVNLDDMNNLSATANVVFTPMDFQEDDRIVIRPFLIPVGGTMPSGQTATVNYDTNIAASQFWVQFMPTVLFKAESDPAAVRVPDGLAMGGVGN